jgi:hypothetical protein
MNYRTGIYLSSFSLRFPLLQLLSGNDNKNALDVVFDDQNHIIASRFIVQVQNLSGLADVKECMLFLRGVFRNDFPQYNLTAYTPVFAFAELVSYYYFFICIFFTFPYFFEQILVSLAAHLSAMFLNIYDLTKL